MAGINPKVLFPPQGSMTLCSQYLWESSSLMPELWGKLTEDPRQLQKGNYFCPQYPSTAIPGMSDSSGIPGKQYNRSRSVSLLPNWLCSAQTWSCFRLFISTLQAGAAHGAGNDSYLLRLREKLLLRGDLEPENQMWGTLSILWALMEWGISQLVKLTVGPRERANNWHPSSSKRHGKIRQ